MNWNKVQEILEYSDWDLGITEQNLIDLGFELQYMDEDNKEIGYYFKKLSIEPVEDIGLIEFARSNDRFEIELFPYSKLFTELAELELFITIMESDYEN